MSTDPTPAERGELPESIGPWRVHNLIARGGMAAVYGVSHAETRERRALKLLQPMATNDETEQRFRREFRALSRLHHPNVLRVHEWDVLDGRPWFTMDWLEGHDLRDEIEGLIPTTPEARYARVEDVLIQLARALAYVHEHGIVHRDVTPGNIFIEKSGQVKLMDFGVAKEIVGDDMTGVGEVIGTVAYMSPEQINGDDVDARADLYSVGAVLYLMLTGRRVFQAHTIHGFMEKHLKSSPRPPREVMADVPPHLEQICLRLLEKDPRDRYASAAHLLHVLGDTPTSDFPESERGDSTNQAFPARTVGRTILKARISEAIEGVANGRPGRVMLLSGPSGQGKTRMLEVAARHAKRLGLPVASGRCREKDRPFGAFTSIYKEIRGNNPPQLLEDVLLGSNDDKIWERYPILSAFRDLVIERAPLVLSIDDVHRADPATVELLYYLIRNTLQLQETAVLFLLGHDAEERRIRTQLEAIPSVETFPLNPLDPAEVEELVVSVLGSAPSAVPLANRLHAEANGSPALITDMLRGLMDDGRITREGETGEYRPTVDVADITSSKLPMPASLRRALQERLAPLTHHAMEVGRVLAHARRRVDLDVLVDAVPLEEEDVMSALDALVDADIVREHRSDGGERVELSHGRFREVLRDGVSPQHTQQIHRALGEALERFHRCQIDDVVAELAYHFEHAGIHLKAYEYLLRTASRHLHRSLNHEALGFLERALELEPSSRPYMLLEDADRRLAEVYLSIAGAKHALGQIPEAVIATQKAEQLARDVRDPGLQSRVATELAGQFRHQGSAESAEEQARLAIQRAEEAGDQHLLPAPLYELGGIVWSRGDLDEADRLWRRSLQIAQQLGDDRAQGRGYNGLAILAICRGESMDARRWFEQSAALFERLGMLAPLVTARTNLVELYTNCGLLRKALILSEHTIAQAEEVDHPRGKALGKAWRARVLLLMGRYEEAERDAAEAMAILPTLPSAADHATVLIGAVLTQLEQGRWQNALHKTDELLDVLEVHDHESIQPQVVAWRTIALCKLDRTSDARKAFGQVQFTDKHWPHVQIRSDLALGRALCNLGDTAEAAEVFNRALQASEDNGYRFLQLVAHRGLAQVVGENGRERHLRVATGLARSLAANLPRDDADRFLRLHDDERRPRR